MLALRDAIPRAMPLARAEFRHPQAAPACSRSAPASSKRPPRIRIHFASACPDYGAAIRVRAQTRATVTALKQPPEPSQESPGWHRRAHRACGDVAAGAAPAPGLSTAAPSGPADEQIAPLEIVLPGLRAAAPPVLRRHDLLPPKTHCS